MDSITTTCLVFILTCLIAVTFQVLFFSPISPDSLELPRAFFDQNFPLNNELQRIEKLGEGYLDRPEDVCLDKNGVLYTATRDGWIKRMHKNGSWEQWCEIGGDGLLGITISKSGSLIVCDDEKGLLKVDDDGVTVLASHLDGTKIRFADDVIEASDGSLYFSVASNKFGLHEWYLDVLEAKPNGQLLKYDPSMNETTIVLTHLHFANGVALSSDEHFLIVCETWKYRCLKYWLKGEKRGETEIFVDNLPGGPDNINLAPDGSFWIALLELTSSGYEFVHTSKVLKRCISIFPRLYNRVMGMNTKASVVNVGIDGKILKKFDDLNGKLTRFVTSAVEFEGHLYLGSLNTNYIGKLTLDAAT